MNNIDNHRESVRTVAPNQAILIKGHYDKGEILVGQDLDRGRGWEYRRLCSVPPL